MKVNITVKDVNDNKPELAVDEVFLCENDMAGTVNNNPLSERVTHVFLFTWAQGGASWSHRRCDTRTVAFFIKTRDNFRPGWVKIRKAVFSNLSGKNI